MAVVRSYSFTFFILIALCMLQAAHAASFNCTIRAACNANETLLIRLNSSETGATPNNSHAQLANYSGTAYPYSVCCWTDAFRTMTNSCSGNGIAILNLYNTTDSHVEAANQSNYVNLACLNVTLGNISCEYPTSSCSVGFSPIVSIASSESAASNLTNAHVADFNLYNRKVCCKIGAQNPPSIAYVNISPYPNSTTSIDLECQNGTVSDPDSDPVTLHYNWFRNGTSITLLNLPMDYDSGLSKTHDISGYGHDANAVNVTFLPTGGKVGGAFYFNRSLGTENVYVQPAGSYAFVNTSVTAWIKRASTGHWAGIIGLCSTDWYLAADNTTNISVSWQNSTGSQKKCSLSGIDTNWHFVAVTSKVIGSAVNVTLYIDGSSASCSNNEGMTSSGQSVYVGSFDNACGMTGGMVFNGTIDELMIFNKTLSSQEINTEYLLNNRWMNNTELTRGDRWNCSITPIDSTGLNGSTLRSNQTNISGSLPPVVSLLYPANNNNSVFERNVNFTWAASNERDGDQVNYTIQINSSTGGLGCGAPYVASSLQSNLQTTNLSVGVLCVDFQANYYNWTVRACDIDGCSAWAPIYNFTIASVTSLRLVSNNTNFGTLSTGQSIDTSNNTISPFVVENDGNVQVNVSIKGNNSPFSSVALGSTAFQYKARVNETNAYNNNSAYSQQTYTPVTTGFTPVITQLNYTDNADAAYVDINITVPVNEPPGAKSANVTFFANVTVTP